MRRVIDVLVAIAACVLLPHAAIAQPYPSKPIRWIVPFPPGGPTDGFSRGAAQKLSEVLGQPVIVENVPGAGASIGMERIARSAPDGYTIGLATTGTHAINPHLYGSRLPHDTSRDFTPLTLAVRYVNVLVVNPKLGIESVPDLVAYARAHPDKVTFGSAGNGSSNHLSGEVLKMLTGAPMQHVPYRGSAPALADVIAGNITFMFDILITAMPSVQAGRVKALGVTSERRSPYAPRCRRWPSRASRASPRPAATCGSASSDPPASRSRSCRAQRGADHRDALARDAPADLGQRLRAVDEHARRVRPHDPRGPRPLGPDRAGVRREGRLTRRASHARSARRWT
jgi:tripartite-type tricarboxylate transporter receptor subunit TctC